MKATIPEAKPAAAWMQMDDLQSQLLKLDALIAHTCGESFEAFDSLNEEAKGWYLMQLSDLVRQCKEDAARITELLTDQAQAAIAKEKA